MHVCEVWVVAPSCWKYPTENSLSSSWFTEVLNITEEIQAVTADVLARIFQNMARRFHSCLDANVGHFQHML
jgi:hypothetical protein